MEKANELWLRAGKLGCSLAYFNLGNSYNNGRGVEVDKKKAPHFHERAAMNGDLHARHNLGCYEGRPGNSNNTRAMKHFMSGTRARWFKEIVGYCEASVHDRIHDKDDYANTLRA